MDTQDREPKREQPPVRFDVPKMFRLCGGQGQAQNMVNLLMRHHGVAPKLTAASMWSSRGTIPSLWQAAVLYALMREGHTPADLMTRDVPV